MAAGAASDAIDEERALRGVFDRTVALGLAESAVPNAFILPGAGQRDEGARATALRVNVRASASRPLPAFAGDQDAASRRRDAVRRCREDRQHLRVVRNDAWCARDLVERGLQRRVLPLQCCLLRCFADDLADVGQAERLST